ncbi:MAG: hypothetical protein H6819_12980 [Phycisphaerales bacterium]|nr:hypothetical protein [Phycisphaerales bacterium]MCB9856747.1 hypothetical protein [Phycisphaerales bacterium]MCB9862126.1 hypothetical protein [Phycisphaerales bacterium]
MPVTLIWTRFGSTIEAESKLTLGAFLGDKKAIAELQRRNLKGPTLTDFCQDPAFNPNPCGFDHPREYLETLAIVKALSTWGRSAVVRAVTACSGLQCLHQVDCDPKLRQLRDSTAHAVNEFVRLESEANLLQVKAFAKRCFETYEPYEEDPDGKMAVRIWSQLGAPWFAAEAITQDWKLQSYDGPGPATSQSTWCKRNSVWPERAADAAAECTSHKAVRDAIKKELLG